MSKDNETKTKKRTREEKKKLMVRIIALVMAILMVLGMAYYAIYMITLDVKADSYYTTESTQELDTSSLNISGDVPVTVGLMYGENITTDFMMESEEGFTLGTQALVGDREFNELWDLDTSIASCVVDDNLAIYDGTYTPAEYEDDTVIGGYHIGVYCYGYDRGDVEELIDDTKRAVKRCGLYIIPSYYDGDYQLRIGAFTDYDEAYDMLEDVADIYDDFKVRIVEPSSTAISVVDPYTDTILFEYDCLGEIDIGFKAHTDYNGNEYIKTPAGNIYTGVFDFGRCSNDTSEGIYLINVIGLEAYIAGVLPYEVTNYWPIETLKAFAIVVRSYTLTNIGRHGEYGFDLCNTACCQVYKGAGKINQRVLDAVLETEKLVMTYEGETVIGYYSSSTGGVTVNSEDAWEGEEYIPYLRAIETPWEDYMNHDNAFWIIEATPEALCERLNKAGYSQLEDAIESVEITEFAENSTYVKGLRVTDIYGNTADLYTTETVRTSLTPYVNSANFVVGKGSVEYTEDIVIRSEESYLEYGYEEEESISLESEDDENSVASGYTILDDFNVMTSLGIESRQAYEGIVITTANGDVVYDQNDAFVITRDNAAAFLGDDFEDYSSSGSETEENGFSVEIIEDKTTDDVVYKVAYADNEENFIFVGKGWGHGVGMSQYGARDLAWLGYTAEEIIHTYYTDVEIESYSR